MLFTTVVAFGALSVVSAQNQTAPVAGSNPVGVTYRATLHGSSTSNLTGYVAGTSNVDGVGIAFNVDIANLPDLSLGPFMYHIHEKPVPSNGNCTGTGAHLDPFLRGESPACDPKQPQTCQVGDLSGKHGTLKTHAYQNAYLDLYVSSQPGSAAFFGNRSIVVHTANKTRIACANFTLVQTSSTCSEGGASLGSATSSTAVQTSSVPNLPITITTSSVAAVGTSPSNTPISASQTSAPSAVIVPTNGASVRAVGAGSALVGLLALIW